jgi:hypothetical protein
MSPQPLIAATPRFELVEWAGVPAVGAVRAGSSPRSLACPNKPFGPVPEVRPGTVSERRDLATFWRNIEGVPGVEQRVQIADR